MMLSSFDVLTVFWRATWQAAMLAVLVFLICKVFQRSISASAKTLLWTVPILRLIVLVIPASSFSIFNATNMLKTDDEVVASQRQVVDRVPPMLDTKAQSSTEVMQSLELKVIPSTFDSSNDVESTLSTVVPPVIKHAARSITLTDGIVAIWFLGMAGFLVRYLWASFALRKVIAAGRAVALNAVLPNEGAAGLLSKAARRVRFIIVEDNLGPAVAGVFGPVVLLPRQMVDHYSQDELKMVVMHELEHIQRHDTLLLFIAQIAAIVHWCNPLVYWLRRQVQAQAEIAVDAATLRKLGGEKVNYYAELLFKIASVNRTPAHLLSMARKSSTFRRRIEHLAEVEHRTPLRTLVGVFSIVAVALTGLSDATSQERTPETGGAAVVKSATEPTSVLHEATNQQLETQTGATAVQKTNDGPDSNGTQDTKAMDVQRAANKTNAAQAEMRSVSGRVVDSKGQGVPNARLFCESWTRGLKADHRATTDRNGEFVISFPLSSDALDSLYTWVYAKGFGLRVVAMQYAIKKSEMKGDASTVGVTIPLPPLETEATTVQVLDPDGAPVAGTLVCPAKIELPNGRFLADEPAGLMSSIPEEILGSLATRTDEDGKATFDRFPNSLCSGVACQNTGFGRQAFFRVNFGGDMQLRLLPVGSIRGKIKSENPARFKNLIYSIETQANDRQNRTTLGASHGTINDQGEFHIPAIAAGSIYRFTIGGAYESMQEIELICDDYRAKPLLPNSTLELKLEAPPTVAVSGVVLTSDTRQPVSGAKISCYRKDSPHHRSCTTNENGEFQISVAPGKVIFQMISVGDAMSGRYSHAHNFPDEITEKTELEILLPVNKQVKGKLQDAAGRPISNQNLARHLGVYQHVGGMATTDGEGNFTMYLRSSPTEDSGYWAIVEKAENDKPVFTMVNQMNDSDDFFVLERPTIPLPIPKRR